MMRKKKVASPSRGRRLKPIQPGPPIRDVIIDAFGPPGMQPDGGMPMPDFNPQGLGRPNRPFANPEPDMGVDDAWAGQSEHVQPFPFPGMGGGSTQPRPPFGPGPGRPMPVPFPGMGGGQAQPIPFPSGPSGPAGIPGLGGPMSDIDMLRALLMRIFGTRGKTRRM